MARAEPSIHCPACDESIPLGAVLTFGSTRIMVCPGCRHRQSWHVDEIEIIEP
jgi:hypothetical protein